VLYIAIKSSIIESFDSGNYISSLVAGGAPQIVAAAAFLLDFCKPVIFFYYRIISKCLI
jgi:hypothetical protein